MVTDDFGHWLAGFIDGEGCFSDYRAARGSVVPLFAVCLRDDDRPILEEIRERTGLGTVRGRNYRSLVGKPQAVWQVHSKSDCLGLVELLDRYPLRARKARDYAIWRLMVLEWQTVQRVYPIGGGRGSAPSDWTRMVELGRQLREVRSYA